MVGKWFKGLERNGKAGGMMLEGKAYDKYVEAQR